MEFGASIFFTDYSITPAELAADEGVANGASERGEMLAFAHIPTGTATNNEFDIDEVNSRHLKLAVAPAIGADIAMTYGKIPTHRNREFFSGRNRELNRAIREFSSLIRESRFWIGIETVVMTLSQASTGLGPESSSPGCRRVPRLGGSRRTLGTLAAIGAVVLLPVR